MQVLSVLQRIDSFTKCNLKKTDLHCTFVQNGVVCVSSPIDHTGDWICVQMIGPKRFW